MFPYLVVFAICLFLNWRSSSKKILPILLACLILSLLAGFRDLSVGADTDFYPRWYISALRYIKSFPDIVNLETDLDKGYLFLYWIGAWIDKQIWIELFLTELVISVFTFLGCYRLSKHFGNSLVLFTFAFLFLIFNYTLNAMRQECAIAITFFAFSYLWEKRWIYYILWMSVAYTFHSSAIISLAVPFLLFVSNIESDRKRKWVVILTIGGIVIALASFYYIVNMIVDFGVFNEAYATRYGEGGAYAGRSRVAYAPFLIGLMIYYFIFLSYRKKIVNNKVIALHVLLNTIYILCLFLSLLSVYLYRVGLGFYIIDLYLFSVELSSKKVNDVLRTLSVIVMIVYWVFSYIIKNNSETYPYTSKFLGID